MINETLNEMLQTRIIVNGEPKEIPINHPSAMFTIAVGEFLSSCNLYITRELSNELTLNEICSRYRDVLAIISTLCDQIHHNNGEIIQNIFGAEVDIETGNINIDKILYDHIPVHIRQAYSKIYNKQLPCLGAFLCSIASQCTKLLALYADTENIGLAVRCPICKNIAININNFGVACGVAGMKYFEMAAGLN